MMKFFFDTADTVAIQRVWDWMKGVSAPEAVLGVTTNPNAMSKVQCEGLIQWEARTRELCELVTKIRNDNRGVVYVQQPNSSMSPEQVLGWAKLIRTWGDGSTAVALKIPPFKKILSIVDQLSPLIEVNVTGVADCATALRAFSYGVRYVSLIPGRMEEQGIDAKAQIAFVHQRKPDRADIIAGSMRTIEGLRWVCSYGTVPTIGMRVWDAVLAATTPRELLTFWTPDPRADDDPLFSPLIDQRMTDLSKAFFEQMDELGRTVYEQWSRKASSPI